MANLPEQQIFDAAVYELAITDPVMGGPGGVDNQPHQNLTNRTAWLKQQVDALILAGGSAADITAAINAHLAATDPHAQYTTDAEVLVLIAANAPAAPVASVAGKTGAVVLVPSDVGAISDAQRGVAGGVSTLDGVGNVPATELGNALGIGQVWTDMRASRTAGANYTNTTGSPIMVCVGFGSGSAGGFSLVVGGVTVSWIYESAAQGDQVMVGIVPNNTSYLVNASLNGGLNVWSELR